MRNKTKKEFKEYNDYQDRPFGLKWGTAFALDELTQAIEKNKRKALKNIKPLSQMNRYEIDNILQTAFLKTTSVSIQLNEKDSLGNLYESIEGKFSGYANATHLYIENEPIPWESIRNIKII